MLGAIIGDIVGSTRERNNIKTENFELVPRGSRFTDDTVMTLAVAEWLMTDPEHKPETLIRTMQTLGRKYPYAGFGGMFIRWIFSETPVPYGSFGNGSAMRVSPVGLYAESLEEALKLAEITASVTHNHPEGIKGAQAVAAAVFLAKHGGEYPTDLIKEVIRNLSGYNLDTPLEEIRPYYTFDVTCQGSVPQAISAYLQRADLPPETALRLAISIGGDSDTIGAITCSIATAAPDRRMPREVQEECRRLLTPELLDINDRFEAFIRRRNERREVEEFDIVKDSIRGSLMGGAAGDALGYTVEFMRRREILDRFGINGITKFYIPQRTGKALISDDTQMTLFTANGLLWGITRGCIRGVGGRPENYVEYAYRDWYYTQTGEAIGKPCTWLRDILELHSRRAPGNTCLSACRNLMNRKDVENNSKGCGGIMRVAPLGCLMAGYAKRRAKHYSLSEMATAGAEIARVTHKHPLGFLPAAMLTYLIYKLIPLTPTEAKGRIVGIVGGAIEMLDQIYPSEFQADKEYLKDLTRKAVWLASSDIPDAEAIKELGEGWVAEETWAIALYCALRHIDSIEEALIASVNHDGDSDSTGSVCGNIMGAIYGYEMMKRNRLLCPEGMRFEETLELHDIILTIADDLYTSCIIGEYDYMGTPEKYRWHKRYVEI